MKCFARTLFLASILIVAACAQTHDPARRMVRVEIDPTTTYQTMTGWEVTARVWEMDKARNIYDGSWLTWRGEIVDVLVDDAGINRIRIELRSGAENPIDYWSQFVAGEISYTDLKSHFYEKINDNANPDVANAAGFQFSNLDYQVENLVLPMQAKLAERGERLHINLCYIDFKWTDLKGPLSHADEPREYAELVDQAFLHLEEKYGIVPDSFELVLEPDNTHRWWGGHMADGLVAVAARLEARGITPRYIAPSTASANAALPWMNDFAKNSEAMQLLSVLAYHRYDGAAADTALPDIVARAEANGLQTEMLEYVKGDINHLYSDLVRGNASAWQRYGVATKGGRNPKPGYMLNLVGEGDDAGITLADNAHDLAAIFRAVRMDAVRIGARSDDLSIRPLAFHNADGQHVIILLTSHAGAVEILHMSLGEYTLRFLPKDQSQTVQLGEVLAGDDLLTVQIPGPGVFILQQDAP